MGDLLNFIRCFTQLYWLVYSILSSNLLNSPFGFTQFSGLSYSICVDDECAEVVLLC